MRVLDLFCGPGGASMGYRQAGFEVVGVDIEPQPHYPFEFIQGDAMTFPLEGFDFIHASPPCQRYSRMNRMSKRDYKDLIAPIRERLKAVKIPYVVENVPSAPLDNFFTLCGTMFGLEVIRHRIFETSWEFAALIPPHSCYRATASGKCVAFRNGGRVKEGTRPPRQNARDFRDSMKCFWMTVREARSAIPPAYTRFIAESYLTH